MDFLVLYIGVVISSYADMSALMLTFLMLTGVFSSRVDISNVIPGIQTPVAQGRSTHFDD